MLHGVSLPEAPAPHALSSPELGFTPHHPLARQIDQQAGRAVIRPFFLYVLPLRSSSSSSSSSSHSGGGGGTNIPLSAPTPPHPLPHTLTCNPLPPASSLSQGWNKFCFTGGYLEARLKQPGTPRHSGLWSAFWVLGNLGRAGNRDTTAGMWPFSYSACDAAARDGQAHWPNSALPRQNYSACDDFSAEYGFAPHVGRGVPEIDVFELVVPWKGGGHGHRPAHLSTSVQMGPKIPPNTVHGAGPAGDCHNGTDRCTGVRFYADNGFNTGMNEWCMKPNAWEAPNVLGNELQVCARSGAWDPRAHPGLVKSPRDA